MSEEILHLVQDVVPEYWTKHADELRTYHHREIARRLVEWLVKNGPAVISKPEEHVTTRDWGAGSMPMTRVEYVVFADPIGQLRDMEFVFLGGPADGQRLVTQGQFEWRVAVAPTLQASDAWTKNVTETMRIARYIRRREYYRFDGWA